MKKALLGVVVLALTLTGSATASDVASHSGRGVEVERLLPVDHSGVHGFVLLHQLHEGSRVAVLAFGLEPNTAYGSFYYTDGDCDENPEGVGTFTSNARGIGFVTAVIDEDVDEVGSVSVRTPDYSVLFACADFTG